MRNAHTGFTLMELMVVIAIVGVLAGLALPSFRGTIQRAESKAAGTAFYGALQRARSEAIARNTAVSICARDISNLAVPTCATGNTAWRDGWIIYTGPSPSTPIQVHEPIDGSLQLGTGASALQFFGNGSIAATTTFALCRGTPDADGRSVVVTRSGRVSLAAQPC